MPDRSIVFRSMTWTGSTPPVEPGMWLATEVRSSAVLGSAEAAGAAAASASVRHPKRGRAAERLPMRRLPVATPDF